MADRNRGQMIFTDNHSKAGTGIVPVIPNYTEMQAGAYGIQKYRYERTAVEAGIRLDRQETRAGGYDWTGNYYGETENSVISRMAWAGTTDFQNTGSLHPTSH